MSMKTNFDTVYIHYGADEFSPKRVRMNSVYWPKIVLNKPSGFWASPVNAKFGWVNWCKSEEFYIEALDESFNFKLTKDARILEIHTIEDILPYTDTHTVNGLLAQDSLMKDFDGIELYLSENWDLRRLYFDSWDCDSICIWNPDVVEEV